MGADNEFYFGAAVDIDRAALPKSERYRCARFWKYAGRPGCAWVIVWPECRTSKPFVYIIPLWAIELSIQEEEPPLPPLWCGPYKTIGVCMFQIENEKGG